MFQTQHLNPSEISFGTRCRIQINFLILGICLVALKASALGSFFGPRLFLWPCMLFYLSVFTPPFMSILHIFVIGLIHDSLFNYPLGASSVIWMFWYLGLATQRRFLIKTTPMILWITFSASCLAMQYIYWFLLRQVGASIDGVTIFIETLLMAGFFPFTLHSFNRIFARIGHLI